MQSCTTSYEHRKREFIKSNAWNERIAEIAQIERKHQVSLCIYIYINLQYSIFYEKAIGVESMENIERKACPDLWFPRSSIFPSNLVEPRFHDRSRRRKPRDPTLPTWLLPAWEAHLWGRAPCQIFMAISRASQSPTIF